jgi:hypothetical protein
MVESGSAGTGRDCGQRQLSGSVPLEEANDMRRPDGIWFDPPGSRLFMYPVDK